MANIFKQNLDITEHINRNNHDLSHKVHGTYKMGYIYPFLCKPVVPNDSFRIDTACGFQLMPMPFPTQSNIRCIFHYFYVRNKNIWENWENWHEGLEEHTPPYINQGSDFYKTGSLADYLDIPTTIVRGESITKSNTQFVRFVKDDYTAFPPRSTVVSLPSFNFPMGYMNDAVPYIDTDATYTPDGYIMQSLGGYFKPSLVSAMSLSYRVPALSMGITSEVSEADAILIGRTNLRIFVLASKKEDDFELRRTRLVDIFSLDDPNNPIFTHTTFEFSIGTATIGGETIRTFGVSTDEVDAEDISALHSYASQILFEDEYMTFGFGYESFNDSSVNILDIAPLVSNQNLSYILNSPSGIYELSSVNSNPYYGTGNTGTDTQKISALPFRAYESIYYAYYANSVIQPLKINGETKYNRYNTTLADGADSTSYHLFQRNWELDAYTSCLPSPQQGDMPLVGITDAGDLSISDPNTGERSRFHLIQDGDRQTIQVDNVSNPEHSRLALDLVTSGITIPDFREVNAYQRLKEQALRSGYKYKDFVKGNFGISPKQNELDMPEFIGGFSQRVDVNMISNTNGITPDGSSDVLGSFAGQGRAFGGSKHGISHYFDDYGWIIGVMMIVPDCAYSQLLPKHFIYNERLDYYFPQFAQLGLQPVTYGEVAPIQSHLQYTGGASNKLLTDVFGYQRPNHEYVWYPDSIHGQIRKSLNNIVINRVFDKRPELSDEFLKIDPKDTDKIFAVTEDDNDVVVGQIAMKITAKRPIPRIVIPTLGR